MGLGARRGVALSAALIAALAGCGEGPGPAARPGTTPVETRDTGPRAPFDPWAAGYAGDPVVGRDRFVPRCAACHGVDGRGGLGPDLATRVPLFTDLELYTVIVSGNGEAMPAIDVDVQEGVDIVAWLRATFDADR